MLAFWCHSDRSAHLRPLLPFGGFLVSANGQSMFTQAQYPCCVVQALDKQSPSCPDAPNTLVSHTTLSGAETLCACRPKHPSPAAERTCAQHFLFFPRIISTSLPYYAQGKARPRKCRHLQCRQCSQMMPQSPPPVSKVLPVLARRSFVVSHTKPVPDSGQGLVFVVFWEHWLRTQPGQP